MASIVKLLEETIVSLQLAMNPFDIQFPEIQLDLQLSYLSYFYMFYSQRDICGKQQNMNEFRLVAVLCILELQLKHNSIM